MNARDFALFELDARRLPNWPAGALRRHGDREAYPSDARDVALAEQIVVGVVKNLLLLQFWIEHYSNRRLNKIDPIVQKVLAVGLYQIRFLDRIPSAAAVDEAVEQCKRMGRVHAAGLVNAVLRSALRQPPPEAPPHTALSHPQELVDRLKSLLGETDALRFCHHDNQKAPTIVRLGHGVDPQQLMSVGLVVAPHERPGMYVVAHAKQPTLEDWAKRGVAQVQDPTAATVAAQCNIQSGQKMLDRCCGMGTKTLQLHEMLGQAGTIFAIDSNAGRCQTLRQMLSARGICNIGVIQASWLKDLAGNTELPAAFDRVLVDAPCSNSGVLARRAEARYAQDAKALASLAKLQDEILDDTAPRVAPGGLMIYSTCSVWPEENGQRTERFFASHVDFEMVAETTTLPSFGDDPTRYHDGGYICVMRRRTVS